MMPFLGELKIVIEVRLMFVEPVLRHLRQVFLCAILLRTKLFPANDNNLLIESNN